MDDDDQTARTRDERPSTRHKAQLDHADTEPAVVETRPSEKLLDAGRRYTMGAEIARGGMGRVVEATDTLLGRTVALKAALAGEPEAVRRFARETRVTARLEHPSIVPVYDAGKTTDGVPFYVMRKVAGRPLEALVHERRTIDERLALLPHVLAAVDAVAHAHTRGVLHRDLKPSNILVGELGETVVIDWGLAKVIDDPDGDLGAEDADAGANESLRTRVGQVVGTPGFMAPEQLNGDAATRSCDVYALGGTLYHVLAGQPPHAARSSDEMIALALAGPPRPIAEVIDGVPAALATIVERAMSYNEHTRYEDGGALAADLRRFLTGQLVAAHHYSATERTLRFVKRHRGASAIGALALAVVGVVGYVSINKIVGERNLADEARAIAEHEKQAAEQARSREAERADDLLLAQASALVGTNPTVAVGLLHNLPATSKSWQKARDVLAEARLHGVPWVLPSPGFLTGSAITADGKTAFSANQTGVVRRFDLEGRVVREVHRAKGRTSIALTADDKYLAIADQDAALTWMEVASGRVERVALPARIDQLAVAGTSVVFHDGRALWVLPHGEPPTRIDAAIGKVFAIVASPDGARVAVNADPDAVVIELGITPRVVVRRPSRSMVPAWSADGKRLAIAHVAELDEIDFTDGTPVTRPIAIRPSVLTAAYVGEDLYFTTVGQAFRNHPRDGLSPVDLPAGTYSSAVSTRDAAVFSSTTGSLAVTGRGGTVEIRGPVPRMFTAITHPHATRFVVPTHDHLMVYDAAAMLPRSLDVSLANTTFHGFAGNAHYVMGYMLEDWQRFDLASGAPSSLGRTEFGTFVGAAPDGSYVIARDRSQRLVVLRSGKPPEPLANTTLAAAVSASTAAVATQHDVALLDLAASTRSQLWTSAAPIEQLLGSGNVILAYAKGTLWRRDLASGVSATAPWTARPSALDVAADGSVWIAADSAVWRWAPDGELAQVARLPRQITRLTYVVGVGCIAVDDRRGAVLIDDATHASRGVLPSNYELAFLAENAPLVAGLTHDHKLAIYDLEAHYPWMLGAGDTMADISDDGRHVVTYNDGRLSIYAIDLPADRAGYERQLDATTNLRISGSGDLVWPK